MADMVEEGPIRRIQLWDIHVIDVIRDHLNWSVEMEHGIHHSQIHVDVSRIYRSREKQCNIFPISAVQVIPSFSKVNQLTPGPGRSSVLGGLQYCSKSIMWMWMSYLMLKNLQSLDLYIQNLKKRSYFVKSMYNNQKLYIKLIFEHPADHLYRLFHTVLRLPYINDAETAKFCNLWTFWPVIQPIRDLFVIWQKSFLPNAP